MAQKVKNPTIKIADQDHRIDDLTEQQKYLVLQTQDLMKKAESLKFQLDQVNVAHEMFGRKLKESLSTKPN